MWKRLSVFCVILVLALSSVGAWSLLPTKGQDVQLELELRQKTEEIQSQIQYIEQLETLLAQSEQDSILLLGKLEASEAKARSLEMKSATLQRLLVASKTEIEGLQKLSHVSEVASQEKQTEIAKLSEDIVTVETENVELYAENITSDWGGLVGGGATYDPQSGQVGATMDMGVRYKQWALVTGVEWKPSVWELVIPSFSDLSFSTGLQWSF